jgi:hypothetical protein
VAWALPIYPKTGLRQRWKTGGWFAFLPTGVRRVRGFTFTIPAAASLRQPLRLS